MKIFNGLNLQAPKFLKIKIFRILFESEKINTQKILMENKISLYNQINKEVKKIYIFKV